MLEKIDRILQISGIFPKGLSIANEVGFGIIEKLGKLKGRYAENRYEPSEPLKRWVKEGDWKWAMRG